MADLSELRTISVYTGNGLQKLVAVIQWRGRFEVRLQDGGDRIYDPKNDPEWGFKFGEVPVGMVETIRSRTRLGEGVGVVTGDDGTVYHWRAEDGTI